MSAHEYNRCLFPRRSGRGSVILFVLGVILLTAFLLTRLIDRAQGELLAETKAANRATLRDQAYSALEVTLAVLADISASDGGLHAPQQGWDKPLEYASYQPAAGFNVVVSYEDETGKLPLTTVNEAVLQHYLETIGASVSDAERLTDALLGWTRKDYLTGSSDADPRNYENSPLPYAPPQRALHTFEELRAVSVARELFFDTDGRWTELGNKFRTDTSLYDFNSVNVNSAHSAVLTGLGLDPTQASAVVRDIAATPDPTQAPKFYRSVGEAASVYGSGVAQAGFGADVQCLRVIVTVSQGARVFSLGAVIQPGSGSNSQANAANPADTQNADPNAPPVTPVDPRAVTRKSIDYPFRILELRESDGPV
jgi:general secretion pathway protein K